MVLFNAAEADRSQLEGWFTKAMDDHVRDVAAVTGMIETQKNGLRTMVENDRGVTNSILHSMGIEDNLKRACFIFHFSVENPYSFLLNQTWGEYHEKKFMEKLNVEYDSYESVGGGFVAKMGDEIFSSMVRRAKGRLTYKKLGLNVRCNKDMVIKKNTGPAVRGNNFKYYLRMGGPETFEVSSAWSLFMKFERNLYVQIH